ncbi:MAG TPA: ester cyclase [Candidatus Dormibacteraeota bacterium]|jgi:steroid delta-isomerase-like uncharacterized protein|nr:ester cyclase [Candidatus Dormibacteraeota bacterium]
MTSERDSIERLVSDAQTGAISRRRFVTAVGAAGATAAGLAILWAATQRSTTSGTPAAATPAQQQTNVDFHQQHVKLQGQQDVAPAASATTPDVAARVQALAQDYHPEGIVEDVGLDSPVIGRDAIHARKLAQAQAIANPSINILNRFAYGDQVVAEWEVEGTHVGDYLGFPASGNAFKLRGLTVVTRREGKIVRESLYYDHEELARQLAV